MRVLLALSIAIMGIAATTGANATGIKSKYKSTHSYSSRSNLGYGKYRNDRQSAVGTRYIHQNFPIWAARAFQPQRDR